MAAAAAESVNGEPDQALLERFVSGDPQAFEMLFRRFEPEVFRWIARIVRDRGAAEDALVDAFWRAYRGRARFDPSRSFGAWMRRIATNAALDQLRAARARGAWVALDESGMADPRPPPGPGPARDIRRAVAAALRALPPTLQLAAVLALVEELPYAEIADALGAPVGTVKSRVFRAIRLLRAELARQGIRP